MALELIENQLVKLYSGENFNQRNKRLTQDMRTYCQIVRTEQKTMFQVRVTEETGEELLLNYDFTESPIALPNWFFISGTWMNDNGRAYGQTDPNLDTAMLQQVNVDANSYYVIEIKVDEVGYYDFVMTFAALGTPDYSNGVQLAITQAGTYQIYFSSLASTSVNMSVSFSGLRKYVKIDYISMIKLTTPVVTLETCTGVLKRTITPFARELDLINYEVEWLDLPDDCYRVCVTGVDDLDYNYLSFALSLGTEGGAPLMMEDGGFIKWYG